MAFVYSRCGKIDWKKIVEVLSYIVDDYEYSKVFGSAVKSGFECVSGELENLSVSNVLDDVVVIKSDGGNVRIEFNYDDYVAYVFATIGYPDFEKKSDVKRKIISVVKNLAKKYGFVVLGNVEDVQIDLVEKYYVEIVISVSDNFKAIEKFINFVKDVLKGIMKIQVDLGVVD